MGISAQRGSPFSFPAPPLAGEPIGVAALAGPRADELMDELCRRLPRVEGGQAIHLDQREAAAELHSPLVPAALRGVALGGTHKSSLL